MSWNIQVNKIKKSRISEVDFNHLPFGRIFTDHMFSADYIDGQWTNLEIRPVSELSMHPANMTLHYGQGIFEGMKASKDQDGNALLFRPEMNARRLNASARRMCMAEIPEALFLDALSTLVSLEADWIPQTAEGALYIRPFMIAYDSFIGVAPSQTYKFMILLMPTGLYFSNPVKLWVEREYVRAVKGGTGEAKAAGNYGASLFPAAQAKKHGYDQVLWTDAFEHKWIQEGGAMNVFFVIDELVVTPALDGAILNGITRDSVLTLLNDKGYDVQIRPVSIDELFEAHKQGILKEAFGCGTAVVVSPIGTISDGVNTIDLDVNTYQIAPMLKAEINNIRLGRTADIHGWVKSISMPVSVS